VNDTLAGRQVKCPKCSAAISVPSLAPAPLSGDNLEPIAAEAVLPVEPSATYGFQSPAYGQPYGSPLAPYAQQAQPYAQPQNFGPPQNPYLAPPAAAYPQAQGRGRGPLTPAQRTRYNLLSFALGIPGLLLYFGCGALSRAARASGDETLAMIALFGILLAIALYGGGLAFSAMYKGQHPAWGLLGLTCIIGLIIIALLPDRGKPVPQYWPPQYGPPPWPPNR
jgi:hypothetical protein